MRSMLAFLKKKKRLLLIMLLVAVVAVTVCAITFGVVGIGHKDEGYYAIDVKPESAVTVFDSGLHLMYYAQGESDAIKQTLNQVGAAYSQTLERAYKLLDSDTEYEGYVNIATLNRHPGHEFEISEALYAVLSDALRKTNERKGYSMFGGALHHEWRTIRYLEEPFAFDPLADPTVALRLESIAQAASAELYLSGEDARAARFDPSPSYLEFLAASEVAAPILDLNQLHDAYLIGLVASDMVAQGFDSGYLYTDGGVCVMLNRDDMRFDLFGCADGKVSPAGGVSAKPFSVCCQLTAFALTESDYGYYAMESDGEWVYRHPWIDMQTGKCPTFLWSLAVVADEASPADVMYRMLPIFASEDEASVRAALSGLSLQNATAAYSLSSSPSLYRVRQSRQNEFVQNEGAPYTKQDF